MPSAEASKQVEAPLGSARSASIAGVAEQLHTYETTFAKTRIPIPVNFRELAGRLSFDRLTHLIHPYPAKLLPHIPHYLLRSHYFSSVDSIILDPFCGSGTVLLEVLANRKQALGADSNPLARLISRVKIRQLDIARLDRATKSLFRNLNRDSVPRQPYPDVVNIDYWFAPSTKRQLSAIRERVAAVSDTGIREFFEVAFSCCVRNVSLADPRLSVPVRLRPDKYSRSTPHGRRTLDTFRRLHDIDVVECYKEIVAKNRRRLLATAPFSQTDPSILTDSRALGLADSSIDGIISSPPYVSAQKYIRASSLSLGWLGLAQTSDLRRLEDANIGREHHRSADYQSNTIVPMVAHDVLQRIASKNPLRAHIAATYLVEMADAIREMLRVLRPAAHAVLVVGNNTVAGEHFNTAGYIAGIVERLGATLLLVLDDCIRGRGLLTSRHDTAGLITHESVLIFRKDA